MSRQETASPQERQLVEEDKKFRKYRLLPNDWEQIITLPTVQPWLRELFEFLRSREGIDTFFSDIKKKFWTTKGPISIGTFAGINNKIRPYGFRIDFGPSINSEDYSTTDFLVDIYYLESKR